ncbi:MAG TPA: potassium-transporting ATPase subunit F [Terracidiphilus sp.]|jgi:K+-transporting ATPase KdpF subunit|nr:potassium-transporting ATPase subunit F [Terracidiphilus sp.]
MTIFIAIALLLAIVLTAYLFFTLLFPEKL